MNATRLYSVLIHIPRSLPSRLVETYIPNDIGFSWKAVLKDVLVQFCVQVFRIVHQRLHFCLLFRLFAFAGFSIRFRRVCGGGGYWRDRRVLPLNGQTATCDNTVSDGIFKGMLGLLGAIEVSMGEKGCIEPLLMGSRASCESFLCEAIGKTGENSGERKISHRACAGLSLSISSSALSESDPESETMVLQPTLFIGDREELRVKSAWKRFAV